MVPNHGPWLVACSLLHLEQRLEVSYHLRQEHRQSRLHRRTPVITMLLNRSSFLHKYVLTVTMFIPTRISFVSKSSSSSRLRLARPCTPAQLRRVGRFHIRGFQVRHHLHLCVPQRYIHPSLFDFFILFLCVFINLPSFTPPLSSTAPVQMLSSQDGCSLVEL